jgi:hypothetical protein
MKGREVEEEKGVVRGKGGSKGKRGNIVIVWGESAGDGDLGRSRG